MQYVVYGKLGSIDYIDEISDWIFLRVFPTIDDAHKFVDRAMETGELPNFTSFKIGERVVNKEDLTV